MRYLNLRTLSNALVLSAVLVTPALTGRHESTQAQTVAQEKAANLRSQLLEVEARQAEMQTRLQQVEESLKPENIEHSLAGVGSTRPEELREQKRRQLEIERNGVKSQLDILARSHSRLESAIAQADAEAYRQSAAPQTTVPTGASSGGPSSEQTNEVTTPAKPRRARRKKKTKKTKPAHHVQLSVNSRY